MGLHEELDKLRAWIQRRIDVVDGAYDAILLDYGLCGNGTGGVRARGMPIVIPRARDLCTVHLGSYAAFPENFEHSLSASWSSVWYIERSATCLRTPDRADAIKDCPEHAYLLARFGEKNAGYVWDVWHPVGKGKKLRFIELAETEGLWYAKEMRERAATEARELTILHEDSRLLRALLAGDCDDDNFIVVPPGQAIVRECNMNRVLSTD